MIKINNISPDKHPFLQITTTIAKPPKSLYFMGDLPEQRCPTVAIVGTRKPTRYGIEVTTKFATELANKGVIIISGLALGVDAIAHRAALDANGTTLAVLGNGLPDIHPRTNRTLGERILAEGGAIISEYETDAPVYPTNFLARNRIVAGLADAVLITEANASSGTLNTAMHAMEQGKDVFVIPGNITSPLSAGCNNLIKQGATLVTTTSDILEVIAPNLLSSQNKLPLGSNALETSVIQHLQAGVRDGEELHQLLNCSVADFNMTLTMLEINDVIKPLGANQWALR